MGENALYFIDFGTGAALAIHGPDGPISKRELSLPRVLGGRTPAMEFPMVLEALFKGGAFGPGGDVAVESPTIGSSGCEIGHVQDILDRYPERRLLTITARAIKNYRRDHGIPWKKGARYARTLGERLEMMKLLPQVEVHVEDATIGHQICVDHPERMHHWVAPSDGIERIHTSVRPMDKHLYRCERSARYLGMLPPFQELPEDLREALGNGKVNGNGGYSGAKVMPFAMASEEPHVHNGPREERRRRYEKVIGLYDRGYPSFYRRASIVWMHENAKALAEAEKFEHVTATQRKAAWKTTQRQIRQLFHLTMEHQGR